MTTTDPDKIKQSYCIRTYKQNDLMIISRVICILEAAKVVVKVFVFWYKTYKWEWILDGGLNSGKKPRGKRTVFFAYVNVFERKANFSYEGFFLLPLLLTRDIWSTIIIITHVIVFAGKRVGCSRGTLCFFWFSHFC